MRALRKYGSFTLGIALLLVFSICAISSNAFAIGSSLYVAADEAGVQGDGTRENPYRGLAQALNAASDGDTLVLTQNIVQRESGAADGFTFDKAVTVKGENHTLSFRGADVFFDAPVVFDSLTLNVIGENRKADLWAQGHDLIFKNVNTKIGELQDDQRPTIYSGGKTAADNTGDGSTIKIIGGDSNMRFANLVLGDQTPGATLPAIVEISSKFAKIDQGITSTTSGTVLVETQSSNVKTFTGNPNNDRESVVFDGVSVYSVTLTGIDNLFLRNKAQVTTVDEDAGVPLVEVPVLLDVAEGTSLTIGATPEVNVGTIQGTGTVAISADTTLHADTVSGKTRIEARAWSLEEEKSLLEREFFTAKNVTAEPVVVVRYGGTDTAVVRNDEGKWIGAQAQPPTETPVDTTGLEAEIAAAEKALRDSLEAESADQVAQGRKWAVKAERDALLLAVQKAQAVLADPQSQAEVTKAVGELNRAVATYTALLRDGAKVAPVDPDPQPPVDPQPEPPVSPEVPEVPATPEMPDTPEKPIQPETVTVIAPEASDPASCTVTPFVRIPDVKGVIYKINGHEVSSGMHVYGYGAVVVVRAEAQQGFVIAPDTQTEWSWVAPTREALGCTDLSAADVQEKASEATDGKSDEKNFTALAKTGAGAYTVAVLVLMFLISGLAMVKTGKYRA